MTEPQRVDYLQRASRRRRPPRRRRLQAARVAVVILAAAIVFVLGIALGEALEDNPSPGGSNTFVRTFAPLPTAPVPQTVTVTVTSP